MSQSGDRASLGKFIVFIVLERRLLVWRNPFLPSHLGTSLVWRNAFFQVITIGDVMDSTVMHITKGNALS